MKKRIAQLIALIPAIGLSLFLLQPASGQSTNCSLLVSTAQGFIDGHDNASGIGPGDTICLLPGQRSWLWIRYLHGTAEQPIVIMNTIGVVAIDQFYYGIKIDSCSHIKLSGKGVSGFSYGITISEIDGGGMSIEGLSTDIEVEGIEIFNTIYPGLFCKTDPDCSFTSTRDKYVMRNISLHDNFFHDIGTEGFYIGNSFYNGVTVECNGKDTVLLPHLIRGLKVYNNILLRIGWDGIQVSCADSGCAIYGNEIYNDSEAGELDQMNGIIVGNGSGCDCFNNSILYGKGTGIQVVGLGGNKIYNNLIVNPGRTYTQEYPFINGIYVGDQSTIPGSNFLIAYNTIISPKDYGIDFRSLTTSGNQFINNIVMNWGRGIYQGSNLTLLNNYTIATLDPSQFVDIAAGNFDLKPTSAAVNTATLVDQLNLTFDILNRNRPFSLANDIGAFECHDPSLIGIPELIDKLSIRFTVELAYPTDALIIRYFVSTSDRVNIDMYNMTGGVIKRVFDNFLKPGEYEQQVDVENLPGGIYILRMSAGDEIISKKVQLYR